MRIVEVEIKGTGEAVAVFDPAFTVPPVVVSATLIGEGPGPDLMEVTNSFARVRLDAPDDEVRRVLVYAEGD